MLASLFRRFRRDRRAITAMTFALMISPMIIAAGAAVDFARLASSRAQLQAAVDGAALAGTGAYANEDSGANAIQVATAAFKAAESGISGAVSLSSTSATVGCTGTTGAGKQCGATGTGITESSSACVTNQTWCTTVTATATQKNLLFYHLGSSKITVTATSNWGTTGGSGPTSTLGNAIGAGYTAPSGTGGNGGVGWAHTSGLGNGSLGAQSSTSANAWFVDGFNNAAPTFLTFSSLPKSSGSGCSTLIPGTGTNSVLTIATNANYCSLTLGNGDRKSTRLNSSHFQVSRMPSSA